MPKTLRICLAMGGGVSLGSFSGGSLTEALKLLILYGKDKNGAPYEKVIVDGMSGASAGAIALTIMLKSLIDYKGMLSLADENLTEEDLVKEIEETYFKENPMQASNHRDIETLKALQLAQKIQYKIWVEEVDALKLYGEKAKKSFKHNSKDGFALLERKLLEKLTKRYLMADVDINISNKQLLNEDRVIFACSLTNLLPIEVLKSKDDTSKLEKNFQKSTGSQSHSELRIIDFVFNHESETYQNKPTDDRWLKFSKSDEVDGKTKLDINSKAAWATIAASALACGAFPIAFEPVLLKRYCSEYGGKEAYSQWPKQFLSIQDDINQAEQNQRSRFTWNSYFNEKDKPRLDYDSFNFPYIDGGTFNNEPIREAFKIGSFQDFDREIENEDRLVLFVDPIVRKDQDHSFRLNSLSAISVKSDNSIKESDEISKLTNTVSNIIGVLANQGSIKEEHKIIDVKENLKLRETIYAYIGKNEDLGENLNLDILEATFIKIKKNLNKGIISLGTRLPIEYFLVQLKKNCKELGIADGACLRIDEDRLKSLKKAIENGTIDTIDEAYIILDIHSNEDRTAFAQAVFKMIIDFSLNTDGKRENAFRAAILPITSNLETTQLPGEEIFAFGGFASVKSRKYAFEYSKYSALLSLSKEKGFRKGHAFISSDNLNELEQNFKNNIESVNFYNLNSNYKDELTNNLFKPSFARLKHLLLKNKTLNFFLTKMPFALTSILAPVGGVWLGLKSLFSKTPWRGSNILNNLVNQSADSINYISLPQVGISILSDFNIKGKLYIKCADDSIKKVNTKEFSYTDGNGRTRYQYLYKLSLLEYIKDAHQVENQDTKEILTSKMPSENVERMRLSLQRKVKIPNHIDGNLNPIEKRKATEKNFKDIITEMRIDRNNLPFLSNSINNHLTSLHYSLLNLNSHLNPIIEIDLEDLESGWYFKEDTESLDRKLMR